MSLANLETIHASFDPRVKTYWLLSGAVALAATIVGIPLLLLWFPIGSWVTGRYLESISAELTPTKLIVRKGVFNKIEKTIPLEKITDMSLVEGPIMRFLGVQKLSVETAGQSGQGALVSLIGVVDAPQFREEVLERRDEHASRGRSDAASTTSSAETRQSADRTEALLKDIATTLRRIDKRMQERSE